MSAFREVPWGRPVRVGSRSDVVRKQMLLGGHASIWWLRCLGSSLAHSDVFAGSPADVAATMVLYYSWLDLRIYFIFMDNACILMYVVFGRLVHEVQWNVFVIVCRWFDSGLHRAPTVLHLSVGACYLISVLFVMFGFCVLFAIHCSSLSRDAVSDVVSVLTRIHDSGTLKHIPGSKSIASRQSAICQNDDCLASNHGSLLFKKYGPIYTTMQLNWSDECSNCFAPLRCGHGDDRRDKCRNSQ